ncbi:hypothetical protein [Flavobacterium sp. UMI-01]|uniref:hypothetical protein n=1 Tax=Flavobacterium sp. UMI-01 TaxID=1441053 RepID=UPI001C7D2953|nr:hypothetical protein [Flavobacterium sp. UMI-01]GIZ07985.1 hypothetical protein FUMI01_07120 [Flavobacterium sp. UMI-01]
MKKVILMLTVLFATAVATAQTSTLKIVKINNMIPGEFKKTHPVLKQGETLMLTVSFSNILKDRKDTRVRARILNDFALIDGSTEAFKQVSTSSETQTIDIPLVVPNVSEEIKTARIQVLGLGIKPDGSQDNIYGYTPPFEIK